VVGRYRTHESMHAHFMLALYGSGRRGEAIDVYRRMRTGLVTSSVWSRRRACGACSTCRILDSPTTVGKPRRWNEPG
jgi:transcriptional activator